MPTDERSSGAGEPTAARTPPERVLVVGASAGGLSTVEALRRKGYAGRITVLGDEVHPPYDRPPLSKQVLSGAWEPERARLRDAAALDGLDADFLLGDAAVALDATTRSVRTASGRTIGADAIVIATGVRARMLLGQQELTGVYGLRTLEDALALREELANCRRLVVVGEGVLGAETAATACALGVDVTMVGPQPAPMVLQIGPLVSGLLGRLHEERGVRLRLGTGVACLVGENGRASGVRLEDGELLSADVVVVSIGGIPATDWLVGSGLLLDNGVVCDSHCRAAEGIYAVGDVARWHHAAFGRVMRLENRTNATEQAAAVAAAILGEDAPYSPVPYFWTDQFDAKLQVHGTIPAGADCELVEGDIDARRFVVRYLSDGLVTGVLGWNMPKQTRLHRQELVDSLNAPAPLH